MYKVIKLEVSMLLNILQQIYIKLLLMKNVDSVKENSLYVHILIILIAVLSVIAITTLIYCGIKKKTMKKRVHRSERKWTTGDEKLDELVEFAGYAYDETQDMFYSIIDAWQREYGYCRLYDEAAAPLGMIMDCEPIYFEYDGKRWLIEFWKGQYDLVTGGEIGIYVAEKDKLNITDVFDNTLYSAVKDEDMLPMIFYLKKKGRVLFVRKARHWWLTGFKLGEFSEPWELTMSLNITLKNEAMRDAFIEGLNKAGYSNKEIAINGNTVALRFKEPHSPQPVTRIPETDKIIQKKNKLLCEKYQEITAPYDKVPDKIKAVQEIAPEIYKKIINMGKGKELFYKHKKIKT